MSQAAATFIAKRFIGDRAGNYFKRDDPYFEATDDTPGGRKVRPKKKALPPGLSERDQKILKKVRKRAYHWDRSMNCCCCAFRFGWSAIIGIIPVLGAAINLLIAMQVVRKCMEVDLPQFVVAQMYTNVAIDFGIGLIPVVGDFADAWFKCNTRNNILLERYLRERGQKHPVAPSPAKPQQSKLRRWFGSGVHPDYATAEHAQTQAQQTQTQSGDAVGTSQGVHPSSTAATSVGHVPPKLPPRGARDGDLEAGNAGDIHYRREA